MELAINRKNGSWISSLLDRETEIAEEETAGCEHFAYRRTLLFYTEETCRFCRYARMVKPAGGGKPDYVCACAAHMAGKDVG